MRRVVELGVDRVARAASARARRIAALGHESVNDAVKGHRVVEALSGEEDEAVDVLRSEFLVQVNLDHPTVRHLDGGAVVHAVLQRKGRRLVP